MGPAVLIGLQMSDRPVDRERFLTVGLEWAQTNVGLTVEAHRDGDQVRIRR